MTQITYLRFRSDSRRISRILFIILVFGLIKFFTKDYQEYFGAYALVSFLCLLANLYFGNKATRMLLNSELRMNWFESWILKEALITILGVFTLWLFFVEGLYGFYLLFKSFSIGELIVRIAVIMLSYKLALPVANLQDALKWLSKNTWN